MNKENGEPTTSSNILASPPSTSKRRKTKLLSPPVSVYGLRSGGHNLRSASKIKVKEKLDSPPTAKKKKPRSRSMFDNTVGSAVNEGTMKSKHKARRKPANATQQPLNTTDAGSADVTVAIADIGNIIEQERVLKEHQIHIQDTAGDSNGSEIEVDNNTSDITEGGGDEMEPDDGLTELHKNEIAKEVPGENVSLQAEESVDEQEGEDDDSLEYEDALSDVGDEISHISTSTHGNYNPKFSNDMWNFN